jgi:epoxyqueuosine reductase QueG
MTSEELAQLGEELGIDVVGAAAAQPYAETERTIEERRARGLFADMRFTMAQPEVSCHPETLLPGARTVVSAALCYYAPGPDPGAGQGRLPRYTWADHYAELRATLDADVELEPTAPLKLDCGSCTLCIEACPTGALDDPGVVDATKCLSYWTQAPAAIPVRYRKELGRQVYGCDICQDVCPWNRGVEKRRAESTPAEDAEPVVSLLDWLRMPGDELRERYDRLYFPNNDPRYLRRNALVAAGNAADTGLVEAVRPYAEGDDQLLREHAEWALARLEEQA